MLKSRPLDVMNIYILGSKMLEIVSEPYFLVGFIGKNLYYLILSLRNHYIKNHRVEPNE